MATRYRLDPQRSRLTAQAFVGGFLSALGHSPTFAVSAVAGTVDFPDESIASMRLEVTVELTSLSLLDKVSVSDRQEIEGRMRGEVLEVQVHPNAALQATVLATERLAPGQHRLRLGGSLTLHGVSRDARIDVELAVFDDHVRLRGGFPLRMSDYGIAPVKALAGAIKLKDEVKLTFEVVGLPEAV